MVIYNVLVFVQLLAFVSGHARLMDPCHRGRVGKAFKGQTDVPFNTDDTAINCGGAWKQWGVNDGKCGVCGDAYGDTQENVLGNKYGGGFIPPTSVYQQGQIINVIVDVTANHKGYFQFRVCPAINKKTPVTKECLNRNLLKLAGNQSTEYTLLTGKMGNITIPVQLPANLSCNHCVFQWYWKAGNNYGTDKQETFINCADIAIQSTPGQTPKSTRPTLAPTRQPSVPEPTRPVPKPSCTNLTCTWSGPNLLNHNQSQLNTLCVSLLESSLVDTMCVRSTCNCRCEPDVPNTACTGNKKWRNIPDVDPWCERNCGICPTAHCRC